MTVQRARELIGQDIEILSDQEVSEMIQRDSSFMEVMLELLTNNVTGEHNGHSD